MDDFVPQSGNLVVREGHEESDLSIKGIVTFLILLAVGGGLTFIGVRVFLTDTPIIGLKWWESQVFHEPPQLTAAEKQLQMEREGRTLPAAEAGRTPEWYGRGAMEEHLSRTFQTPRLQYDDVLEMDTFRADEDKWLETTGKTAAGSTHISIDRAKDLLVTQGLPKPTEPFVAPVLPSAAPLVPAPAAATPAQRMR
jgi:hypothetical protein